MVEARFHGPALALVDRVNDDIHIGESGDLPEDIRTLVAGAVVYDDETRKARLSELRQRLREFRAGMIRGDQDQWMHALPPQEQVS